MPGHLMPQQPIAEKVDNTGITPKEAKPTPKNKNDIMDQDTLTENMRNSWEEVL
jgi:hypothetical protein